MMRLAGHVTPATTEQLRAVQQGVDGTLAEAAVLQARRSALFRQAIAEGWTHQNIAEATGLTRQRVSQLARREDSHA